MGSILKGKNILHWEQILAFCSSGSKFLPLRVDPILLELLYEKASVDLCENCHALVLMVG